VRVIGHETSAAHIGVVSVTVDGYEPQEFAAALDASFGVQTRAGLHCAPLICERLGVAPQGGTVRFSLGGETTEAEIAAALRAVEQLLV
jgi:cysteine desulfurase/selenocysteine lyase